METTSENIIKAYNIARETGADSTCKVLEALYPEVDFNPKDNRPVTERIKTFEDACAALGNHALVNQYRRIAEEQNPPMDGTATDLIAYLKLRIITAALNEGWEPQFTEDEWIYYPWFYLYTQEELDEQSDEWKQAHNVIPLRGVLFGGGSRLCFKSRELAVYAGNQFADIYMRFHLISK